MDKIALVIILIVVALGAGFFIWQNGSNTNFSVPPTQLPEGVVLFYSPDCPHCMVVEDFISTNKIADKVKFSKLEVAFGTRTSAELVANAEAAALKAKECKINIAGGISIPFLWDGNKCYIGKDDIISFFKNAAEIK
jgi:glutaredoxin